MDVEPRGKWSQKHGNNQCQRVWDKQQGSTTHNSQDMEGTYMSIDRWMDKEDVVHGYNGIVLSHKEEWNNAICSNVDAPRDYHTKEVIQIKTNIMISLRCGI